jgi:beta-glucosidase
MNNDFTLSKKEIDELISKMSLEEKASLCSGKDEWTFKTIDRLDVPNIWLADGPHGLRKSPDSASGGYGDQFPATCFPTASALASSWDTELVKNVGKHLGIECQAHDVNVILGPGVNIMRSPMGGRNFEYFSEDPILAGEMGAAYIQGVQDQGVGTSLKHFATNTQETKRMVVSSNMDERTLREIYLTNFEIAVKKGNPWTVMCAYNPFNGIDASANKKLLTDILKEEWGYEGVVLSDWVAVFDRVAGIKAGLHVEMPGNAGLHDEIIVKAVKSGELDEKLIDELLKDILALVSKARTAQKEGITFKAEEHHTYARSVAADTAVLLKNDPVNGEAVLPLTAEKYSNVALIGEFAVKPRYQGNGSSEVKPTFTDVFKDELEKEAGDSFNLEYAQGYKLDDDGDISLIQEAVHAAKNVDCAVVHIGLPQHYESEGYDRMHMSIPPAQEALVNEIAKVQKNLVVVLTNGSPVIMPWIENVPAVLETWLAGQAGGGAIADVLLGKVNPSGKLAISFPEKEEDSSSFFDFPGKNRSLNFGESIFVGYRWHEKRKIKPLFSFGHGLSYTSFEYSNLKLSSKNISEKDQLTVSCDVKNTGEFAGKEIVQLYVEDVESRLIRPVKELKGFTKLSLDPGETKTAKFTLNKRDFSYWNDAFGGWTVESGEFIIHVGSSSDSILLTESVSLKTLEAVDHHFDMRTTLREWVSFPETNAVVYPIVKDYFEAMPDLYEGDLIDFKIKNDFFLDMPMMKYEVISGNKISRDVVRKMLEDIKDVKIKL